MLKLNVESNQDKHEVSEALLKQIEKTIHKSLEYEGFDEIDVTIDLSFVDDEKIRVINTEHRGLDKATDVLSFPQYENLKDAEEIDEEMAIGDIVISVERALEQAKEFDHSFEREMCFLVVHSMLHLFGYDHDTEERTKEMRELEEHILSELGVSR